MKKKKIIFLDWDGVLNHDLTRPRSLFGHRIWCGMERACVDRLNRLVEVSGADIVISSSWRSTDRGTPVPLTELRENLVMFGFKFPERVIDITPVKLFVYGGDVRGRYIETWLESNAAPESFVILDDDDGMAGLGKYLVLTDPLVGLSDADVEKALLILG